MSLHAPEQVCDLRVRVAVVGVLDWGATTEERVGLVEDLHGVRGLDLVEDPAEVLLRLTDVLAHHGRQVDPVEVEREGLGPDVRVIHQNTALGGRCGQLQRDPQNVQLHGAVERLAERIAHGEVHEYRGDPARVWM